MDSHPETVRVQETSFSNMHNGYRGNYHPSPANMTPFGHGMTNGTGHSGASSSGERSGGGEKAGTCFSSTSSSWRPGDEERHLAFKAKTAEAACSITCSLELSIARSSTATRARALDWYLKVTKLSTEGQIKQYAEQCIAELQDLIAASL